MKSGSCQGQTTRTLLNVPAFIMVASFASSTKAFHMFSSLFLPPDLTNILTAAYWGKTQEGYMFGCLIFLDLIEVSTFVHHQHHCLYAHLFTFLPILFARMTFQPHCYTCPTINGFLWWTSFYWVVHQNALFQQGDAQQQLPVRPHLDIFSNKKGQKLRILNNSWNLPFF